MLTRELVKLFPHHQHYVSVFGGSGADILGKPPSREETFNDLDGDVYNLFCVIQDDSQRKQLTERLEHTPVRSAGFFRKALRQCKTPGGTPVDRAWAFIYATHQAIFPLHPACLAESEWGWAPTRSTFRKPLRLHAALEDAARRFRGVRLTDWDWSRVIRTFDSPDILFYCDPPYYPVTLTQKYYGRQMFEDEHKAMLETIQHVKGYVVISGYDSPLYRDMLAGWRRKTFRTKASVAVRAAHKSDRVEVIWMNYEANGSRIGR